MDNNPKGAAAVPASIKAAAAVQGESCGYWLCSPAIQPSARGGNPPPLAEAQAQAHRHLSCMCIFIHNLPNSTFA